VCGAVEEEEAKAKGEEFRGLIDRWRWERISQSFALLGIFALCPDIFLNARRFYIITLAVDC
jgi:hypothetical protein